MPRLATGGKEVIPTLIDSVQDRDGHVVWRPPAVDCDDCADPSAAAGAHRHSARRSPIRVSVFQIVTMMQGVVRRAAPAYAAGKGLEPADRRQDRHDPGLHRRLVLGFTPDLVTTVWVGFDNPASWARTRPAAHVAAPIWRDFMAVALKGRPVLSFPCSRQA